MNDLITDCQFGKRAFSVCGLTILNQIPPHIRNLYSSCSGFSQCFIKTFVFGNYLDTVMHYRSRNFRVETFFRFTLYNFTMNCMTKSLPFGPGLMQIWNHQCMSMSLLFSYWSMCVIKIENWYFAQEPHFLTLSILNYGMWPSFTGLITIELL